MSGEWEDVKIRFDDQGRAVLNLSNCEDKLPPGIRSRVSLTGECKVIIIGPPPPSGLACPMPDCGSLLVRPVDPGDETA
jgi:hypothetical protein